MITAEAASESTVPAVPGDTAATGVPEREELVWPWKDAPIRALVQRIHQLQAERAQAFRRLEEWSGVCGETRSLPSLCAGVRSSRVTLRGSERPPHSGVEGHFLGGFQAVDGGAGPENRGRSLRTPTCRRGHRQYLSSGPPYDFPRYRSTVHEVTQVFAAASREVLAVEAELAGPRAQPLLASHVRSLQQLEETRLTTDTSAPSQTPPLQGSSPLWLVPVPRICYSALRLGAVKLQVALLQLMGTPELTGQDDSLQMHQLKMKVIKTMEAISEVLQDLRFDAESAE
ncbi:hypothetical protein Celaphus_00002953 [Cervus elaphus hippelaphus]|uniref:Required for excision 1-B domain-containing protein n=1 Tax=Cervus elaphus hippelaphus TaxID=46360 RepID=A0A212D0G1_CEREH|nr:hypothetical protein Celaphus_00002953 [Cervus elaphus hippelaphus]